MKNILITGGSRGLGREIALLLSSLGYGVIVNYLGSEKEAEELKKHKNIIMALRADVGILKEVESMAEAMSGIPLYALINNAGISRDNLLVRHSESDWDMIIRTNLKGCFNTSRVFAPIISASGGGHIINISSRSALRGKPGQAAYSASKAGIVGLTLSLAGELSRSKIRVNAIMPGYMPTEMGLRAERASKEAKEESLLRVLSSPKEVSGFISWLLTTEHITGQCFVLDSRV